METHASLTGGPVLSEVTRGGLAKIRKNPTAFSLAVRGKSQVYSVSELTLSATGSPPRMEVSFQIEGKPGRQTISIPGADGLQLLMRFRRYAPQGTPCDDIDLSSLLGIRTEGYVDLTSAGRDALLLCRSANREHLLRLTLPKSMIEVAQRDLPSLLVGGVRSSEPKSAPSRIVETGHKPYYFSDCRLRTHSNVWHIVFAKFVTINADTDHPTPAFEFHVKERNQNFHRFIRPIDADFIAGVRASERGTACLISASGDWEVIGASSAEWRRFSDEVTRILSPQQGYAKREGFNEDSLYAGDCLSPPPAPADPARHRRCHPDLLAMPDRPPAVVFPDPFL